MNDVCWPWWGWAAPRTARAGRCRVGGGRMELQSEPFPCLESSIASNRAPGIWHEGGAERVRMPRIFCRVCGFCRGEGGLIHNSRGLQKKAPLTASASMTATLGEGAITTRGRGARPAGPGSATSSRWGKSGRGAHRHFVPIFGICRWRGTFSAQAFVRAFQGIF